MHACPSYPSSFPCAADRATEYNHPRSPVSGRPRDSTAELRSHTCASSSPYLQLADLSVMPFLYTTCPCRAAKVLARVRLLMHYLGLQVGRLGMWGVLHWAALQPGGTGGVCGTYHARGATCTHGHGAAVQQARTATARRFQPLSHARVARHAFDPSPSRLIFS